MKLLLDENLSDRIVHQISDLFPDSNHVQAIGLGSAGGMEVWAFARDHGFAILTKDSNFHHASMLRGFPPKILFLQIGNCSTRDIVELIHSQVVRIKEFLCLPFCGNSSPDLRRSLVIHDVINSCAWRS